MHTDYLRERFQRNPDEPAIVGPAGSCSFAELLELQRHWGEEVERHGVGTGSVVALEGDFSPNAVALFLALTARGAIQVPLRNTAQAGEKAEIAQAEARFRVDRDDAVEFEWTGRTASHELYDELRRRRHPGLVAFTSGTSGEPKAAVHDFTPLLEMFAVPRAALSTFTFLLFDHLGGLRTMMHALSNAVTMVATDDRSPDSVCALVERYGVELLPATPTFFNLLLLSGAHRRHDLSGLRVISYGTEPMPESTLVRLREAFPGVKLQQTYGMIEIGPLSSKSREDGSLWMKVGGKGFETRVVDGVLQIRSRAIALGYLNAPSPITADGWFVTGDAVEEDGEYLRFIGRKSELINVGGQKVSPVEVESAIQSIAGVEEATAYGEPSPLLGEIVCARVRVGGGIDESSLKREIKRTCRQRLDRFKVPARIVIAHERQHGDRFKKIRAGGSA